MILPSLYYSNTLQDPGPSTFTHKNTGCDFYNFDAYLQDLSNENPVNTLPQVDLDDLYQEQYHPFTIDGSDYEAMMDEEIGFDIVKGMLGHGNDVDMIGISSAEYSVDGVLLDPQGPVKRRRSESPGTAGEPLQKRQRKEISPPPLPTLAASGHTICPPVTSETSSKVQSSTKSQRKVKKLPRILSPFPQIPTPPAAPAVPTDVNVGLIQQQCSPPSSSSAFADQMRVVSRSSEQEHYQGAKEIEVPIEEQCHKPPPADGKGKRTQGEVTASSAACKKARCVADDDSEYLPESSAPGSREASEKHVNTCLSSEREDEVENHDSASEAYLPPPSSPSSWKLSEHVTREDSGEENIRAKPKKEYTCQWCSVTCKRKCDVVRRHLPSIHWEIIDPNAKSNPQELACPLCASCVIRKDSLMRHLRSQHKITTESAMNKWLAKVDFAEYNRFDVLLSEFRKKHNV